MKRLACAVFGFALLPAAAGAAGAAAGNAPADEYFGPLKYSAISTRTRIDMLGRKTKAGRESAASLVHDADLVNASLRSWAAAYPHDAWLAPTAYHLAQLYALSSTLLAQSRARSEFAYVAATFPHTAQGRASRQRLTQHT